MIFKDVSATLLKVDLKEGTGKTSGKPYKFYTVNLLDDSGNVMTGNVADVLEKSSDFDEVKKLVNQKVSVDLEFKPKGFDFGLSVFAVNF